MPSLGVKVFEQATSVSTPNVASVGVPFVVGTAPVHAAEQPAPINTPVLCTSWSEAVKQFGYSDDWEKYSLCEFMYSHFKLYGCQPVVFLNVLDPASAKETVSAQTVSVIGHQVTLPSETITASIQVSTTSAEGTGATTLEPDTDYISFYDGLHCVLELQEDGKAYSAASLSIAYDRVKPDAVKESDIADGDRKSTRLNSSHMA